MAAPLERPSSPPAVSLSVRLYHVFANALIGALFGFLAYVAFINWRQSGQINTLILVLQEMLIVGLVITRRRAIQESRVPSDWLVALLGTAGPLLLRPAEPLWILEPLGVLIQLAGLLLATIAIVYLGRSFGIVAANRGVRTDGLYRYMRHPLYGAYIVGYIGFLLGNLSLRNILLIIFTIGCQYARAVAEERVLLNDPAYAQYALQVRYRFIPYVL